MREAQKVERLGFSQTRPFAPVPRIPAQPENSRLYRMQFQSELGKTLSQSLAHCQYVAFFPKAHHQVSGPGDFHPRALSEPYVNVSAHTAPIIQPSAAAPAAPNGRTAGVRVAPTAQANAQPADDDAAAF